MNQPTNETTGSTWTAAQQNALNSQVNIDTNLITDVEGVVGIVKSNGSGGFSAAIPGTDFTRPFWVNVLDYGADPTGGEDSTNAFNAAKAALPTASYTYPDLPSGGGWVYAPTGNYKISSTLQFTQFQGLRGDGSSRTIFNYTGTGPCINAMNTNAPTGWPTPCGWDGFGIDGSANANANSGGMQTGNLDNSVGDDIQINNFTKSGSFGIFYKNFIPGNGIWSSSDPYVNLPAAEKMRWTKIGLRNNTTAVIFDGAAVPQGQFDLCEFDFEVFASVNQNGLTLQNDALLGGAKKLTMVGNFATNNTVNTGWVLGIDVGNTAGVSSIAQGCELFIVVETDGGSGDLGHKTIVLGSQSFGGISATGTVWFVTPVSGGSTWQGLSTPPYGYTLALAGNINEPVLGTMTYNDCFSFQGGTQWGVFNDGGATIPTSYTILTQYGDVQQLNLPNTACTIAGFNGAPYASARRMDFFLVQPASGAPCVMTWPSNVVWANGYHTLSTTNSAVDHVHADYSPHDDKWYCTLLTNVFVNNSDGTLSVTGVNTLEPLSTTTILTASTSPAIGQTTYYNATSGNLTPSLPALSGLRVGARLAVRRDPADSSSHTVTLSCTSPDTFYSSGTTSTAFPLSGEQREFQVISVSGTKYWAPSGSINPISALDARYVALSGALGTPSSGVLTNCTGLPLAGLAAGAYSSSTVTPSTLAVRDTAGALYANNYVTTPYIQAASSTTLALGANSAGVIVITGTTQNQIITLPPAANELEQWKIYNATTAATITCNGFSSGTAAVIPAGGYAVFTALSTAPTTAAAWHVNPPNGGTVVVQGGALGTPVSGVLSSCTGYLASALSGLVNAATQLSGMVPIANGGTNASTAATGLANLAAAGIPNALLPDGILNANSALQFVSATAATNIYITNSQLACPATYLQGMTAPSGSGGSVVCGTVFRWRVSLTKNGNGTGTFTLLILRGTAGTTSDTTDVSQLFGTMTAAVDTLVVDVQVTVLTTGATGSYYWSMTTVHSGSSATGFGLSSSTGGPLTFNGTVTGVAMNTASLVFGLGFVCTAGGTQPNISVPTVQAQAFNID